MKVSFESKARAHRQRYRLWKPCMRGKWGETPVTCGRGPKLGLTELPTDKTLHCVTDFLQYISASTQPHTAKKGQAVWIEETGLSLASHVRAVTWNPPFILTNAFLGHVRAPFVQEPPHLIQVRGYVRHLFLELVIPVHDEGKAHAATPAQNHDDQDDQKDPTAIAPIIVTACCLARRVVD